MMSLYFAGLPPLRVSRWYTPPACIEAGRWTVSGGNPGAARGGGPAPCSCRVQPPELGVEVVEVEEEEEEVVVQPPEVLTACPRPGGPRGGARLGPRGTHLGVLHRPVDLDAPLGALDEPQVDGGPRVRLPRLVVRPRPRLRAAPLELGQLGRRQLDLLPEAELEERDGLLADVALDVARVALQPGDELFLRPWNKKKKK